MFNAFKNLALKYLTLEGSPVMVRFKSTDNSLLLKQNNVVAYICLILVYVLHSLCYVHIDKW